MGPRLMSRGGEAEAERQRIEAMLQWGRGS